MKVGARLLIVGWEVIWCGYIFIELPFNDAYISCSLYLWLGWIFIRTCLACKRYCLGVSYISFSVYLYLSLSVAIYPLIYLVVHLMVSFSQAFVKLGLL